MKKIIIIMLAVLLAATSITAFAEYENPVYSKFEPGFYEKLLKASPDSLFCIGISVPMPEELQMKSPYNMDKDEQKQFFRDMEASNKKYAKEFTSVEIESWAKGIPSITASGNKDQILKLAENPSVLQIRDCSMQPVIPCEDVDTVGWRILADIDGDGEIKAADARLALRQSAKLEFFTDKMILLGDINRDGEVGADDARTILRISAELEEISGEDSKIYSQSMNVNQTARLTLQNTGNGDYKWSVINDYEDVKTVQQCKQNDENAAPGAPSNQIFEFTPTACGKYKFEFILSNAHDVSSGKNEESGYTVLYLTVYEKTY